MIEQTPFASPQLELLELDDTQWVKVQQRIGHRRPRQRLQAAEQLRLFDMVGSVAGFLPYGLVHGVGEPFFPHVFTVM